MTQHKIVKSIVDFIDIDFKDIGESCHVLRKRRFTNGVSVVHHDSVSN